MAWIRVIGPEEAEGELATLYAEQRQSVQQRRLLWGIAGTATGDAADTGSSDAGALDWSANPAQGNLMSLNPAAALAYQQFSKIVNYGAGPLTQAQRQMIATVVSAANRCVY